MFEVIFTPKEVEDAQKLRVEENGNADKEGKHHRVAGVYRWCGLLGEEAARRWCLQVGYVEGSDFKMRSRPKEVDKYDILIGQLKVDTKLTTCKKRPEEHYRLNINADQVDWGNFDIWIGGWYVLPERRVILVGWMWRSDTQEICKNSYYGERCEGGVKQPWGGTFKTDVYRVRGSVPPFKELIEIDKQKMGKVT